MSSIPQGQVMVSLKMTTVYSKPTEASFLLSTLSVVLATACFVALPLDKTTVSSHASAIHRLKPISKS